MGRHFFFGLFLAAALNGAGAQSASIDRETTLKILENEKFRLVHRVADLPLDDLIVAGVIPRGRSITTVIADPGHDYQRHPTPVDPSKADTQLIFGAISPNYLLFCTREGGQTEGQHVRLIRRGRTRARLVLHTTVYPEARSMRELRWRLREGRWEPFEVDHPSMVFF